MCVTYVFFTTAFDSADMLPVTMFVTRTLREEVVVVITLYPAPSPPEPPYKSRAKCNPFLDGTNTPLVPCVVGSGQADGSISEGLRNDSTNASAIHVSELGSVVVLPVSQMETGTLMEKPSVVLHVELVENVCFTHSMLYWLAPLVTVQ